MKKNIKRLISLILAFIFSHNLISQNTNLDYINSFELKWNKLPTAWHESAFMGNGRIGTSIWKDSDYGIRFDIGDAQIYKGKSRIPIGKFVIQSTEIITDFSMKQPAGESNVSGLIKTKNAQHLFESLIDIHKDIVRIRFNTNSIDDLNIKHVPLPGIESDKLFKSVKATIRKLGIQNSPDFTYPEVYEQIYHSELIQDLPKEETGKKEDIFFRKVPLNNNTGYILLWNIQKSENKLTLIYSSKYYRNKKEGNLDQSIKNFQSSLLTSFEEILESNQKEWSNYFRESYISIPDKRIEANYWFQIYKMRAATNQGELPIDLLGTWYRATPWPRIWTNLNVQITYPAMNQANKKSIARTLFDYMDNHQNHFINAVPENFQDNGASVGRGWAPYNGTKFWGEYGNFIWMLYNYSQFLEFFPDETRQKEMYYPMLKRGINFVVENLEKDKDGIYHFPADISPEYKVNGKVPEIVDNSYNIGLLNWALSEVIFLSEKFKDNKKERTHYSEVLENLVPLYIDEETGIMVGKGYKMDFCHRHFSHLLAFYPLAVLDISDDENKELCRKSVEHWITRPHSGWGFKGYTYTGAAAMYARLGDSEKALESIKRYLDDFATYNTFYIETGPVIETAIHSASATLEFLLQSFKIDFNQDEIKLFPAIPAEWNEATFSKLRSEGGFIVSASYAHGNVTGACLESVQKRNLYLVFPANQGVKWKTTKNSSFEIQEKDGKTILLGSLKKGEKLFIGNSTSHNNHVKNIKKEESKSFYGINKTNK